MKILLRIPLLYLCLSLHLFSCDGSQPSVVISKNEIVADKTEMTCDTTLVLSFIDFSCICPKWVDLAEYNRVGSKNGFDINQINNYEKGYFIKNEAIVPDSLLYNGNQIKVRGNVVDFKDTIWFKDSPMTHLLEICSFEIIKPYHTITRKFVKIDQWGDSLFEPTITLIE